jgi:hypothetical protein
VDDKRVSGAGYGTTVVVLGALLAVMGVALGVWAFVLMALPFIALGVVTIARRGESRQTRIERNTRYQSSPFALLFACMVAAALWAFAIIRGAPLMFLFASLWTAIAIARLWRATHGGAPMITGKDAT